MIPAVGQVPNPPKNSSEEEMVKLERLLRGAMNAPEITAGACGQAIIDRFSSMLARLDAAEAATQRVRALIEQVTWQAAGVVVVERDAFRRALDGGDNPNEP